MPGKILEGPKLKSAVPEKTLGQLFFECAEKYGDKICQVDGTLDQTETYTSVKQRSTRVAIALQQRRITSNDVIVFCSSNTLDVMIPIMAAFYVGAKVANLDPSLSARQMQHLLSMTTPKIIFVEDVAVNLIEESLKDCKLLPEIIVYGQSHKYATLSALLVPKDGETTFRPPNADLDETAVMFFSSGTTGLPKSICHSHHSFVHIACALRDFGYGNSVMHHTSFYWITAMLMLCQSYMVGGCRVFFRSVDEKDTFRSIEKYKVEFTFMAPLVSEIFCNYEQAEDYDTSSLRVTEVGGTSPTISQFEMMYKTFKHTLVSGCYGLSEVGYVSLFYPEKDKHLAAAKPTSCGKPFFTIRLKVVDVDTNEILGPNRKGEIRIQSPCCFKGYYNADASDAFDEDGFVKTGDIGYYDEDDCIYVVERLKEMFKYQNWHIVPTALESVILEHPAVKEVVVFGVPCGKDGEAPGACVVLKDNATATKEEIFEFVAQRASDREKLRGGITFVLSLPRTLTGKILRKEVKDLVLKSSN